MGRSALHGKRVVVTRAADQARDLVVALEAVGATVIELPLIEVCEPEDGGELLSAALAQLEHYDWMVVTSHNAAVRIAPMWHPAPTRVAAVGTATAETLRANGVPVDLVPDVHLAERLVEVFPEGPGKVLFARAAAGREVVPEGLRAKGWEVDVVGAYRTVKVTPDANAMADVGRADLITFMSSSAVESFVDAGGLRVVPPVVACVGPVTASTVVANGMSVQVVAEEHTAEGLVRALVARLR